MVAPIAQIRRTLLQNSAGTGTQITVLTPGNYAWIVEGTLGGSTVILEALAPDGVTWSQVTTTTALVRTPVLIESGTVIRARVNGGSGQNVSSRLEFIA